MKKIICFLIPIFLFSCDQKLQLLESSNYSVQFLQAKQTVTEGNFLVKIPVKLVAPKQSSDVTVTYDLSGNAIAAKNYNISGTVGSLTIKAGAFADTIRVNVVRDFIASGTQNLIFTISSVSNGLKAGIGTLGNPFTLEMLDADCAFDINKFKGNYNVSIVSEAAFGLPAGTYTTTTSITIDPTANTIVDNNFWDFGGAVKITLDPSDPTNLKTRLLGTQQVYVNASGLPRFAIQGTQTPGSFNTCTGGFSVKMELTRQDGVTVANRSVITYTKTN